MEGGRGGMGEVYGEPRTRPWRWVTETFETVIECETEGKNIAESQRVEVEAEFVIEGFVDTSEGKFKELAFPYGLARETCLGHGGVLGMQVVSTHR